MRSRRHHVFPSKDPENSQGSNTGRVLQPLHKRPRGAKETSERATPSYLLLRADRKPTPIFPTLMFFNAPLFRFVISR